MFRAAGQKEMIFGDSIYCHPLGFLSSNLGYRLSASDENVRRKFEACA